MKTLSIFFVITLIFSFITKGQEQPDNALLLEYYQTQHYGDAAAYLKRFYEQNKQNLKLMNSLAYCYHKAGNYTEAERYYQLLLEQDSTNVKVILSLAAINYQRGWNEQAAGYYKKILQLDSSDIASYQALSTIAQINGEIDTAYYYLLKANYLNPLDADIAYDLGNLGIQLKQYKAADSVLNIALKNDKENILLLKVRAQARFGMHDYKETVIIGDSLRKMGDESDLLLNLLAPAYYFVGDYNKCITTLKRLEEKGELKEAQLYYLAMSYKKLNQVKQAVTYFEKTLKAAISPNVSNYYFEKASLHEKLQQNRTAIYAYQKSLQFDIIPITYYSIALIYDRQFKNKKQALRYYKLYLSQKPSEKDAQVYIAYVKQRISELQ